ncbi:heterokaryon incompatibility protein-domain-containing protein, partial [Phaeosphaeriaceae sp. PMI808]
DSFRLCKLLPAEPGAPIQCILIHEQISKQVGSYCALSYTWGKPTEQRWIRLNGKPFHVWPNLFSALKAIRRSDTELLIWIDAVCINQLDESEKKHQLSLMGNVYKSAEQVLAWVGPA